MGKNLVECAVCEGEGQIVDKKKSGPFSTEYIKCHACNGSGKVNQPD